MVSFAAYQLNFIVIGYKQDLFKLENYQFTKCFINLGVGVCVCACVCMCVCVCVCVSVCQCFWKREVIGIILVSPYLLFQSEDEGKT